MAQPQQLQASAGSQLLTHDTKAIATACAQAVGHLADSAFKAQQADQLDENSPKFYEAIEKSVPSVGDQLRLKDVEIAAVLRRRADLGLYDQIARDVQSASRHTPLYEHKPDFRSVQDQLIASARGRLDSAGGGESKASEFCQQYLLRPLESLRPLPDEQKKRIDSDLQKITKLREEADNKMMKYASSGQYRLARQEEKSVISYDKSALQFNKSLRESCSHYQLVSFDLLRGEAAAFLDRWRTNLAQPRNAAETDLGSLLAHQQSLKRFEEDQTGQYEQQRARMQQRLAALEGRRKTNYDQLVNILSQELARAVEQRQLTRDLDLLKQRHEMSLRIAQERQQQATASRENREQLMQRMSIGMEAISQLRSLEEQQISALQSSYKNQPHAVDQLESLLKEHYTLTRQALGVLLAKSERLKRRVAVLEAKEAEYQFEMNHAFETETPEEEVVQMGQMAAECRSQIAVAKKQRATYDDRAKTICDADFEHTLTLLEAEFQHPRLELEGSLAADERLYMQELRDHHKRQEQLTTALLDTPPLQRSAPMTTPASGGHTRAAVAAVATALQNNSFMATR